MTTDMQDASLASEGRRAKAVRRQPGRNRPLPAARQRFEKASALHGALKAPGGAFKLLVVNSQSVSPNDKRAKPG